MPHRLLTVEEVADYLHLTPSAVRSLVRLREIPFEQSGKTTVFRKVEIDAWASTRLIDSNDKELQTFHRNSSAKAHDLSDNHAIMPELLHRKGIDASLTSRTKNSLITDMVHLAERTELVVYPTDLKRSIIEREKLGTTALRGGVALLHPQHHEPYAFVDSFVCFGRCVQRIPFGSPDGKTTDLFFLIGCQEDNIHLHVLARISMMCYHTRLLFDLRECEDDDAIFQAIVDAEAEVITQKLGVRA